MHAKAFKFKNRVLVSDLKSVSVRADSCSKIELVASLGVKPQLCQLKLKTTHEPKQDVY